MAAEPPLISADVSTVLGRVAIGDKAGLGSYLGSLVRLFRSLDAMVGGEQEPMQGWMRSPNAALADIPGEMIRRVDGLVEAVAYVDSTRARL